MRSKILHIIAVLMVALMVSANLPRAGPDMVSDFDSIDKPLTAEQMFVVIGSLIEVENTTYLSTFHDIGVISVIASTEPLTVEQTFAVIGSLEESRSSSVIQNRCNVQLCADKSAMTLFDFRFTRQIDISWRPMRT